ncbi:chondroitin AC/alginate lyase [Pyrenochaeta sp. MPI-SDFR-AT-0127]|nr:chondroitin AC/alginate lyase [Pyrenochaeta sp. MPI-SDFR-AT-0127]
MSSLLSTSFYLFLLFSSVFAFNHPGLLVNNADIARIKTKLSTRADPWQASWNKLKSLRYSQSTYVDQAVSRVHRGTFNGVKSNADLLWHDVAAAFNLAVRWKIEGNASYAETASNILGAWGRTLNALDNSDDQYLLAGLQGYQLVNAAELLRDYTPFESSSNARAFTTMFQDIFVYRNLFFLNHQAPSEHNVKHFHANWELCNMASAMAFGVYTDNAMLFDFVVEYFKSGTGNGAINNAITNLVLEPGTGLLGVIAQQAWNQGVDLYGYNDSRILHGAEYFARYNLGNDVPFEPWTNSIVSFTHISLDSRGAVRPTWELLYAHYTTLFKNYTAESTQSSFKPGVGLGGEGSGHFDGVGWGSLLHRLGEDYVPAVSSTSLASQPTTSSNPFVASSASTLLTKTSAYVTKSPSMSFQTSTVTIITTSQSVLGTSSVPTTASEATSVNACARKHRTRT